MGGTQQARAASAAVCVSASMTVPFKRRAMWAEWRSHPLGAVWGTSETGCSLNRTLETYWWVCESIESVLTSYRWGESYLCTDNILFWFITLYFFFLFNPTVFCYSILFHSILIYTNSFYHRGQQVIYLWLQSLNISCRHLISRPLMIPSHCLSSWPPFNHFSSFLFTCFLCSFLFSAHLLPSHILSL